MSTKLEFPDSFVWGAATSSYQIEGAETADGRGASVWDTFCDTPGKVKNGDTGAVACDHYYRYREDVALMKHIGLDAYRFSIAWPRIFPQGTGTINTAGLDFYERLVDELLANDIEPWATLYHWDLPQTLEDRGGWPNQETIDAFATYTEAVAKRLSDRVKHWMTLNEPWVFTFLGYGSGIHAPGRTDFHAYLAAAHNAILTHTRATEILRAHGDARTRVGIALNMNWVDSATDSEEDRGAARRLDGFINRWFADPLYKGQYPEDMLAAYAEHFGFDRTFSAGETSRPDFLGLNYYSRAVVAFNPDDPTPMKMKNVRPDAEYTAMDWEVAPDSMRQQLVRLGVDYQPGEIYITENGAAFEDTVTPDGEVKDDRRVAFYQTYLAASHQAIQEGAPLKGYFAWSLMDNFEWAEGYEKRFGITYVDFNTQRRILKDSGKWYSQTIHHNGFTI